MPAGQAFSAHDRLIFSAHSDHPMRLSVQIRTPEGDDMRWRRSVYLDERDREVTVLFDDMRAVSAATPPKPTLSKVTDVMFVIDTVNTKPGTAGQVWIDDVKYGR